MLAVTGDARSHAANKPVGGRVGMALRHGTAGHRKIFGAGPDVLLFGDQRAYVLQMHGLIAPSGGHRKFDALEAWLG